MKNTSYFEAYAKKASPLNVYCHAIPKKQEEKTYLNEEPRCKKCNLAELSIESVMIRIESEVIQEEKSNPVTTANHRVHAYGIKLISGPDLKI